MSSKLQQLKRELEDIRRQVARVEAWGNDDLPVGTVITWKKVFDSSEKVDLPVGTTITWKKVFDSSEKVYTYAALKVELHVTRRTPEPWYITGNSGSFSWDELIDMWNDDDVSDVRIRSAGEKTIEDYRAGEVAWHETMPRIADQNVKSNPVDTQDTRTDLHD